MILYQKLVIPLKVEIFWEKEPAQICWGEKKKELEKTRMVLAPVNNRLVLELYFHV